MSDERTQPPSKRRRQLAREQGQVAHSPELTAAAGWLVAVVVLGMVGEDLTRGLTKLVSGSLTQPAVLIGRAGRGGVACARTCRGSGLAAGGDPGRLRGRCACRAPVAGSRFMGDSPDRSRRRRGSGRFRAGRGWPSGPSVQPGRWSRGSCYVAVSAWAIRAGWSEILKLGGLEVPVLVHRCGPDRARPWPGCLPRCSCFWD